MHTYSGKFKVWQIEMQHFYALFFDKPNRRTTACSQSQGQNIVATYDARLDDKIRWVVVKDLIAWIKAAYATAG